MKEKIIIGLAGQIASGKGTIAKYLEKKYKARTYRFSSIMRDILVRLHGEISRKNMQEMSTFLRKNFGEDILAKVIAEDVKNDKCPIIAVDGVRRIADIKYLKKLKNFKLIRIVADPKIRFERLLKRDENKDDAKKTYEQFLKDHEGEADAEVPVIMKKAKIEINNNGTLKELYKQIDLLIKK